MDANEFPKQTIENIYSRLQRIHGVLWYIFDALVIIAVILGGILWKMA